MQSDLKSPLNVTMGDEHNVVESTIQTDLAAQIAALTEQMNQERESRERLEKENSDLLAHLEAASQIQTTPSSRFKAPVNPMQSFDDYIHVEDDDGSDDLDDTNPSSLVRNQSSHHANTDRTRVSFLTGNRVSLDLDPPRTMTHASRSGGIGRTALTTGQTSMGIESNLLPLGIRFEPNQSTPRVRGSHATIRGTGQMPHINIYQPGQTVVGMTAPTGRAAQNERV